MNNLTRIFSLFLAFSFLFASCSSTTMIQSNPSRAKLYLNGVYVGETPYLHRDTKIVGSSTVLKFEKDGYQQLVTTITRDEEVDVGAIIGGVFFAVPFLWTMKYLPVHHYELRPHEKEQIIRSQNNQDAQKSKADKLRELKQLLDENIITQEEFDKEKAKILKMLE